MVQRFGGGLSSVGGCDKTMAAEDFRGLRAR